ncbi:hypothetical protein BATDEDRAFT_88218 [Batrachochytrium dendrobatidis JAM81]|uniref:Very-long-chain (3R)-3-hydroxyacyl-CoA dehydratase n=1 Tax=Batrachochytrium dendrobatidis (strain JAM81 / FGSC 10211) TaxID=684364 RepID=F4P199_BATDJ|nr:enoyl-CoA hydratase PHS1 [Batrachochytrium dendrobatidis JAM81]EGF80962.1 hypothetical protein BATDEDRAFT_88218 [Batrachochytrium dendrobatidis JAM81]|eukprot:XP_006678765.1 hypothetical protein BATDEDRAFT_88218 [Batrachochytrium dendrobatidis JAM81]
MKTSTKQRSEHPLVLLWLIVYNVASFVGWAYILTLVLHCLITSNGDYSLSYSVVSYTLELVQLCALLEVLHALVGAVKSPVITTALQISSRLFLVGLCYFFNDSRVRQHIAFTTMVLAWSITEVVRYSYYALSLLAINPSALVWARYTFFYVLYPIGAGSELWLLMRSWDSARQYSTLLYYTLVGMAALYPPGFYVMYSHMIKQRRKYLGPKRSKKHA